MQLRPQPADGTDISAAAALPNGHNPFRIDGWFGHAWFARREEKPREEARQTLPALRQAELILSGKGRSVARRPTRIPADAIVGIGKKPSPVRHAPDREAKSDVANDNQRSLSLRLRNLLREVFFLIAFGATLAGTYYLGRMHAFHNVIVVPETPAKGNRIV